MWIDNGYRPKVEVRVTYSDYYLYVYFKAYEKKIRVKRTAFGSDVWNDSCVEMFINPFPQKSSDYINFEINPYGAMRIEKGKDVNNRLIFSEKDVAGLEVVPYVNTPIDGYHGQDYWPMYYKIPLRFFEEVYDEKFGAGEGSANFYKCGDETEFPHFGAWSEILGQTPDFHQSRFFGKLIFE